MTGVARKIGWFFYFAITLQFPILVGALNFENTPDLFLETVLAASLPPAIYFSAFAPSTVRNRVAWFSGSASVAAFLAARVVAFDDYCWQNSFSFCKNIEPPYSEWLLRALRADGHFAEDVIIFQMWLAYCLAIGALLAIGAMLIRNRRVNF